MKPPIKLLIVAGARPNFMKIAPLIERIDAIAACGASNGNRFQYTFVHTGQHYDSRMSRIFLQELGIPEPHENLDAGSGSQAVQTANVMIRFEPLCAAIKPDWVVVVGDVNSTMACALVCAKLGVKVAHVEAGLRSFDRTMPEEINRLLTDAISDLLLTPSADANENLKREGVPDSRISLVGNIMIDTLVSNLGKARSSTVLHRCEARRKQFAYVTLHRPSNVDDPERLARVMDGLYAIAKEVPLVFPMHPRTQKMLTQYRIPLASNRHLKLLEPVGYHDSLCLTENARLVITDSGGLQEESTFFRTPCLTLRANTERPVTIALGSNKLTSLERLVTDAEHALRANVDSGRIPPLWDGQTADRILAQLAARS